MSDATGGQTTGDNSGRSMSFSSIIPKWLSRNLNTLETLVTEPRKFIRGFVLGGAVAGLGGFLGEIFDTAQLIVLGSQPATFGAEGETYGIADVPVVAARALADAAAAVIGLLFDAYVTIISGLIPASNSPLTPLLAAVALVLTGFVLFRIAAPTLLTTLQAVLEAIPVVGGPLATILARIRS
jgi:hypothetical protein